MNPGIFLIQDNEELVPMNEQAYESESLLQKFLSKYPGLLVGDQIDAASLRKWLLVEPEIGVPSEERRLNEIPGINLPTDGISRRPSIPLAALIESKSACTVSSDY